jgi:hypothetical protein
MRVKMIEVQGHVFRVCGIVNEHEPLHDVALDGVGKVVYGIGPVGEAEIDDCRGLCVVSRIGPKEIRCVQIVVGP